MELITVPTMKSRIALAVLAVGLAAGCAIGPAVSKSRDGNLELNIDGPGEANIKQARIYVDDVFVGNPSPMLPVLHLRKGKRSVRVELDGFKPWEQTVHILGEPNHQVLNAILEKR